MSDQQTQSKGFDMAKKKVVEIKNWLTGDVIATGEEGETLRDLVVRKVAEHADLSDAVLRGAVLRGAVLSDAVLSDADLRGAVLRGAVLPSPTAVLLAYWPDLEARLVADLMLFDSTCHPDPTAFDRWAAGGDCPYSGVHVERAARFRERKELWGKGQPCRPYDLMVRVLAEACPEWSEEKLQKFMAKFKAKE